ncbi:transketolase family protein [Anaerotruncus sp. AF02-27]|jgi:transketolase|uniref:transketolase family protein n=1 Tax=Anaerotruncus TaxID=244127 RepID=UPI000E484795|nr:MULTISPECIES: transketolase C-terminal domain-containing protein [Anaerotruncus]RGX56236.1 transketolase family protein [Anaerotruncus sp. AF02-27]
MAKGSCRKAFTGALLDAARADGKIYAVATDSRGSVTLGAFAETLPDQFVEVGIAEQNAVAISAGLACCGKRVFVTGPACFLSARSYEQVKVDIAYNRSDVKVVGVSAGVSYGPLGGTHTALHDFAGMRSLPQIKVFAPADAVQTRFLTQYLAATEGPAYMRMGRGDVEEIYKADESFVIGKAKLVCGGSDVTIIACGEMVYIAKEAARLLKTQGVSARVLDMFTVKPVDEQAVAGAARETAGILTLEEHSIFGGLGEAVAHAAAEYSPVPVKIMGFPDEQYEVGSSAELFRHYGFTPENIAAEAMKLARGGARG